MNKFTGYLSYSEKRNEGMDITSTDIINFWFDEITPKEWFVKDLAFDQLIKDRFCKVHQAAAQGEFYRWRSLF